MENDMVMRAAYVYIKLHNVYILIRSTTSNNTGVNKKGCCTCLKRPLGWGKMRKRVDQMKISEMDYNKRKEIIIKNAIIAVVFINIGVWGSWINKYFLTFAIIGLASMVYANIHLYFIIRDDLRQMRKINKEV